MLNAKEYANRIKFVLDRIVRSEKQKDNTAGWKLADYRHVNNAWEFAFIVPIGFSAVDVEGQVDALFATCGTPIELEDWGGKVVIRVVYKEFEKYVRFREEHLLPDKILIGYNSRMEPIYHELKSSLLIGGAPGSGKSDCLRFIMYQLIRQGADLRVIDMKKFSFLPFRQLISELATDLATAETLLTKAFNTVTEREDAVLFNDGRDGIVEHFQHIVVIIDEGAQVAPKHNSGHNNTLAKLCDEYISKIATKGREPRVSLIYATQRPDSETINKQLKGCCEAAIAFRTKTHQNSEIIIGRPGAEKISNETPGRCIFDTNKEYMLQVPYVGDDIAWKKLLLPFKTEVIHNGSSTRKAESRGESVDGSFYSTHSNNPTNSSAQHVLSAPKESEQSSNKSTAHRSSGVDMARTRESVEANQERKVAPYGYLSPNKVKRTYDDDI